jgi:hypothetical protein
MGNWNWFWNYADWVVVPGSTALEPVELVRGRKPNNTAGSPTMIGTRYGRAINGVDSQIIRYTLPNGGAGLFTRANSWSAFAMVTHENTTEQPCFWGQSGYGGDALLRRANIRIDATQTQGSRTVDFGFSNGGSVQILASLDGTWSPGEPVIAMCSHVAGSSNINAFSYNLTTKKFVASLDAGGSAWTADGSNDAELQILAHYDVDNDPISGPFYYFAFLDNYVMSEGNARQVANDPFGWAYSRKRYHAFKYPPTAQQPVTHELAAVVGGRAHVSARFPSPGYRDYLHEKRVIGRRVRRPRYAMPKRLADSLGLKL